jgi:hypothetical protein
MNDLAAIRTLTAAITAVPAHEQPLPPFYPILAQAETLSLRLVLAQAAQLREHADLEQDELRAIHKVIRACCHIPPTPLTDIPLGF